MMRCKEVVVIQRAASCQARKAVDVAIAAGAVESVEAQDSPMVVRAVVMIS